MDSLCCPLCEAGPRDCKCDEATSQPCAPLREEESSDDTRADREHVNNKATE